MMSYDHYNLIMILEEDPSKTTRYDIKMMLKDNFKMIIKSHHDY